MDCNTFDWQQIINSSSPFVRKWAAENALTYLPLDQAGSILAPLCEDKKYEVSSLAKSRLCSRPCPGSEDTLLKLTQKTVPSYESGNALNMLISLQAKDHLLKFGQWIQENIEDHPRLKELLEDLNLRLKELPAEWSESLQQICLQAGLASEDSQQPAWNIDEIDPDQAWEIVSEQRLPVFGDELLITKIKQSLKERLPGLEQKIEEALDDLRQNPEQDRLENVIKCAAGHEHFIPQLIALDIINISGKFAEFPIDMGVDFFTDNYPLSSNLWQIWCKIYEIPAQDITDWAEKNHLEYTLLLIQCLPVREAWEWVKTNFTTLIEHSEVELLSVVSNMAYPEALEVLKPFLAKDEYKRQAVYQTICALHGCEDIQEKEQEQKLWQQTAGRDSQMARMFQKSPFDFDKNYKIDLSLKCQNCHSIFNYTPQRILLYPPLGSYSLRLEIGGDLRCKHCGADIEHLKPTAASRSRAMMQGSAKAMLKNKEFDDAKKLNANPLTDQQFFLIYSQLKAAEQEIGTISEGIDLYRKKLLEHPGSPQLLVGLGNLQQRLLLIEKSNISYKLALSSCPSCLDAFLHLALNAEYQNNPELAFEYLQEALNQGKQGLVLLGSPNEISRKIREKYQTLGQKLGRNTEDLRSKVKLKKVGRNDLCPCGSGKKYKKCCMN